MSFFTSFRAQELKKAKKFNKTRKNTLANAHSENRFLVKNHRFFCLQVKMLQH